MPDPDVPDWRRDAACRHHDPEVFFPDPSDFPGRRAAAAICRTCPVVDPCLEAADRHQERHGVWGAMARNPYTGNASRIAAGRPRTAPTAAADAYEHATRPS